MLRTNSQSFQICVAVVSVLASYTDDLALNPNNRINSFSISNGQKCRKREYRSRVCFVFSHLDSQDSTSIYIGIYWSKYCFCDSFIYQTSVFTFK